MKNEEKEPKFFCWIRSVRDEIGRDTKGMKPAEMDAYFRLRAEKARKDRILFASEEANRVNRQALNLEKTSTTAPPRRPKSVKAAAPSRTVKATTKTAASRRKVAKRLAHA